MADTVMIPRLTISTSDVFIPEIWSKDVLAAREMALIMSGLVERYDEDAAEGGDVINIPQLSNLTATAKAASTSVTLQAPTETDVNLSLNRHFESSILIEDRLAKQAKRVYTLLQKYAAKSGYAVGKQMDTDLLGQYGSITNHVGDGSTAVSRTNLLRAVQYLDDADAPEEERYGVWKPAAKADLLDIDGFVFTEHIGSDAPVRKGLTGDLFGIRNYVTSNVPVAAGTPTVVHNVIFHKTAFALAVQIQPRTQFQYKQEYLGTLATVDSLWGYALQRDDHAVDYRSSE